MNERMRFTIPTSTSEHEVPVQLIASTDKPAAPDSPLIIIHDGTEYDTRCNISTYIHEATKAYSAAPVIALLDADTEANIWRLKQYGASEKYQTFLADTLIPATRERSGAYGPLLGIGASMGALALLHSANSFDALFLQSASIHHPDYDSDNDYDEFATVSQFVEQARQRLPTRHPLSITMTCGDEPNLRGNHEMFYALRAQGHQITGGKVDGGHNYESWGQAFEPHLREALSATYALQQSLAAA